MPVPETYQSQEADLGGVVSSAALPVEPNWPFFLVHFPDNWEVGEVVLGEGEDRERFRVWLPQMDRQWLEPGINGVRTRKSGEPVEATYKDSHVKMQRAGWVIIPHDVGLCGIRNYMRQSSCRGPRSGREGVRYHDAWERARPMRPGGRLKFERDWQAWNRWRFELVATGIVPEPDEYIVQNKVARARYHAERKQTELRELTEDARKPLIQDAENALKAAEEARVPDAEFASDPLSGTVATFKRRLLSGEFDAQLGALLAREKADRKRASALAAIESRMAEVSG